MKEAANRGGGRSRSRLLLRCQILWSRLAELAVLEGFHGWRFDEHGRACIVVAPGERIVRSRCGRQRREEQREREDGVHLSARRRFERSIAWRLCSICRSNWSRSRLTSSISLAVLGLSAIPAIYQPWVLFKRDHSQSKRDRMRQKVTSTVARRSPAQRKRPIRQSTGQHSFHASRRMKKGKIRGRVCNERVCRLKRPCRREAA